MENRYARVLWHLISEGKSLSEALAALKPVLVRRGHTAIIPRMLKALARYAEQYQRTRVAVLQVAHESDISSIKKEIDPLIKGAPLTVTVDPTIIGGWRLENTDTVRDHSYKKALLDMYRNITS